MSAIQRAARDQRDRGDRGRGRTRGSQVNFYDDMGMSTTEKGHEKFMEYKTLQEEKVKEEKARIAEARKSLGSARGAYNTEMSNLNAAKGMIAEKKGAISKAQAMADPKKLGKYVDQAWNEVKNSGKMQKVHVVSGDDNKVEGTYYVAKPDGKKLTDAFQFTNRNDKGELFVHVKNQGRMMGQELHDMLRSGQQSYETEVKQAAQREIAGTMADAKGQISAAKSEIGKFQEQINTYEGNLIKAKGQIDRFAGNIKMSEKELAGFEQQEQEYLVEIGNKYSEKVKRSAEVLGGLSVEVGEGEVGDSVYDQIAAGNTTNTQAVIQGEAQAPVQVAPVEAEVPVVANEEEV